MYASTLANTLPNYLTPEGAKKLADELQKLASVERPRVVSEVSDAAAQGDRFVMRLRRLEGIRAHDGFAWVVAIA
jgi:hypothetical protein